MHAERVLEFEAIREQLAAECETAAGRALASDLQVSFDPDEVWRRLALTGEAFRLLENTSGLSLNGVADVVKPVTLAGKGAVLGGDVLARISDSLIAMRSARSALATRKEEMPGLWRWAERLPELRDLESRLTSSLDGDGEVKDEASPALASIRGRIGAIGQRIVERIQSYTQGNRRDLLSEPIYTVRDGRYVIPLKAENRGKIKGVVHGASGSGQTVYLEPDDVLNLGNQLREAESAEREEIQRILKDLSGRVGKHADAIVAGLEASAQLDLVLAKARLGQRQQACLPVAWGQHRLLIEKGRHPLLNPETAVPLSLELGSEVDGLMITGPNTGGKTVAIKTVGLFVLMAQSGLMVPADAMRLGPFTSVWADIGDEQSLQQSLSTFSGHVKNIAAALRGLRAGALVLLDEIGAGTDPAEGSALAKALLRAFRDAGAKILCSTHYGELKVFAYNEPGFTNAAMEFDTKSLRPTYRLILGAPGASHALRIAERYGVPKEIVEAARTDLGVDRQDVARMLEKLELAQKQAQRAQSEADRMAARLREVEREAQRKLSEAEEIRKTARARAAEELEQEIRRIRSQTAELMEELKGAAKGKEVEQVRTRLRDLEKSTAGKADRLKETSTPPSPTPVEIAKGMTVRIRGHSQSGTVLTDPRGESVQVQVGALKMRVAVRDLEAAPSAPPERKMTISRPGAFLQKTQNQTQELHLRMLRAEDAADLLDRFLDDAVLAGLPWVRIVHGKGGGVLRQVTHQALRRHPEVRTWHYADPAEGGDGVTVAVFE